MGGSGGLWTPQTGFRLPHSGGEESRRHTDTRPLQAGRAWETDGPILAMNDYGISCTALTPGAQHTVLTTLGHLTQAPGGETWMREAQNPYLRDSKVPPGSVFV